eukprot:Protomagalhaensia_sp_Gyna_25__5094@NODE_583_length_3069_cov_19_850165_g451_i0_p1_GENE_NODE_583_length_3069_cov_19_850165_g451_i0NODE_583_length_3069_cov_19_850165_g451_i0_p1_ORF_typecomplete_len599_score75_16CFEM/PF05730_11/0_43_NODE_583_length_3069_cov_19_850165_g451_i0751871
MTERSAGQKRFSGMVAVLAHTLGALIGINQQDQCVCLDYFLVATSSDSDGLLAVLYGPEFLAALAANGPEGIDARRLYVRLRPREEFIGVEALRNVETLPKATKPPLYKRASFMLNRRFGGFLRKDSSGRRASEATRQEKPPRPCKRNVSDVDRQRIPQWQITQDLNAQNVDSIRRPPVLEDRTSTELETSRVSGLSDGSWISKWRDDSSSRTYYTRCSGMSDPSRVSGTSGTSAPFSDAENGSQRYLRVYEDTPLPSIDGYMSIHADTRQRLSEGTDPKAQINVLLDEVLQEGKGNKPIDDAFPLSDKFKGLFEAIQKEANFEHEVPLNGRLINQPPEGQITEETLKTISILAAETRNQYCNWKTGIACICKQAHTSNMAIKDEITSCIDAAMVAFKDRTLRVKCFGLAGLPKLVYGSSKQAQFKVVLYTKPDEGCGVAVCQYGNKGYTFGCSKTALLALAKKIPSLYRTDWNTFWYLMHEIAAIATKIKVLESRKAWKSSDLVAAGEAGETTIKPSNIFQKGIPTGAECWISQGVDRSLRAVVGNLEIQSPEPEQINALGFEELSKMQSPVEAHHRSSSIFSFSRGASYNLRSLMG